jgi:hypothetical protein
MTAVCGIACKVQLGTKKATVPTKPRPTGLLCFIYSATSVRHTAVKGFAVRPDTKYLSSWRCSTAYRQVLI